MIALAFDPATTTGWALVHDQRLVASGKCLCDEAVGAAYRALAGCEPTIVAIEEPFIPRGGAGRHDEAASTGRAWSAGMVYRRAGYLEGASHALWPRADRWTPMAVHWRKHLGVGRASRGAAKDAVKAWVKATFGLDVGSDEADAVGLAVAAISEMQRRAA
jgi:Holliday junction resolvasome RuvABC endonuclease subunit